MQNPHIVDVTVSNGLDTDIDIYIDDILYSTIQPGDYAYPGNISNLKIVTYDPNFWIIDPNSNKLQLIKDQTGLIYIVPLTVDGTYEVVSPLIDTSRERVGSNSHIFIKGLYTYK